MTKRNNMRSNNTGFAKKLYAVFMTAMMVVSLWPSGATSTFAEDVLGTDSAAAVSQAEDADIQAQADGEDTQAGVVDGGEQSGEADSATGNASGSKAETESGAADAEASEGTAAASTAEPTSADAAAKADATATADAPVESETFATALASVSDSVVPGTYGSYTYEQNSAKDAFSGSAYDGYRDPVATEWLGIAGSFHITGFDEVNTSSHIYGNILTNTLNGGNNFGQTSWYEDTYGYRPLSYVQNYTNPSSNPSGISDSVFVIGSNNTVTTVDNGNHLAINGVQLNEPKTLIQDTDTANAPFIDLAAVKTYTNKVSDDLAKVADVGATVSTEGSNTYIDYEGDSGCAYVTFKASELNSMDQLYIRGMALNGSCSVVVNVEMDTNDLYLSKVHVLLPSGQTAGTGETDSTVGYVMFNIVNSTSAMTISLSDRVLASVLAPNATINLSGSAAGTFIGTKVNVTAESHARPFRGTLKPVVTGVSVNKQWLDAYGDPESADVVSTHKPVSVQLYQKKNDGGWTKYGDPVELSNANSWSHSWDGLTKKDKQGNTYEYRIEEVSKTDDYTSSVAGNDSGTSWTVTNRHVAVGKLSVSKAWDDEDDKDGVRPDSVTVHIVRSVNGGAQETYGDAITLNKGNGWSASVDQLPLKDADGNEYTYAVVEDAVDGYSVKVELIASGSDADGNKSWTYTVTNSHTSIYKETSVSVTKEWLNASGAAETDVDHDPVSVQLYQRKNDGEWAVYGDAVSLSNSNKWAYTWDKLVSVDGYGNTYEYKVGEVNVPDDYTSSVNGSGSTWTITNKRKVTKGKVSVNKVWSDEDDADQIRPASVTVKIVRSVAGGAQEDVERGIELNAGNNWAYAKDNLPLKDAAGNVYSYSVVEDVPAGYSASYEFTSSTEPDGTKSWAYTVTNTHNKTAEYTELSVTKKWLKANGVAESEDVANAHGAVKVQLYKKTAGGQFVAEGSPVELSASNKWSYAWKDLVKTDGYGVSYEYKVEEVDAPADYDSAVSNDGTSWTITNTRKATASLSIEKKWDDDNDRDQLRPASVTVKITRKVDGGTEETYKDDIVLNAKNGWKYSESGLAATDADGKAYTYSVSEYAVDGYAGTVSCATSVDGDGNYVWAFTATNTHDARYEETEVSVTKSWLKANGTAESDDVVEAHGAVKVQLYKKVNDGEFAPEGDAVELSRNNSWSYTWTKLVKTDAQGNAHAYEVREVACPDGYESSSKADGNAWTITNKKTAAGKLSVSKTWSDDDDADQIRPDKVTVKILRAVQVGMDDKGQPVYGDAVDYKTGIELSDSNNWTYACADELPLKDAEGNAFSYSVVEEVPAGYTAKVDLVKTETDADGNTAWTYTVTNSHQKTLEYTDVSVTKSWLKANGVAESDDVVDAHGAVKVQLYKKTGNGEFVAEGDPVELSRGNSWSHTWSSLVKTDAYGMSYSYDVREAEGTEGYDSSVTNDGYDFKVTNKKVATVRVAVEKTWSDNSNVDKLRPSELTVTIKRSANGVEDTDFSETLTLNDQNGWKSELSGLAKADAEGNEYTYTASEPEVEGYTGKALTPTEAVDDDGNTVWTFSFVNTHEQDVTSLTVRKAWDDADDQDGLRPESLTVKVRRSVEGKQGSELVKTLVLDADCDWSATVDGLPVNGPDGAYTYFVDEVEVDGYEGSVEVVHQQGGTWTFSLTNVHDAATTRIEVKKVWDDDDDFDQIRPDEVKVQLCAKDADGTVTPLGGYDAITLSKANNWGADGGIGWSDLPVYASGEKINYTVQELEVTSGYEAKVSDGLSTDDGKTYTYTVTNTHTVDTMEFSLSGYSVASITEVLEPDEVCYVDPKIYKALKSHEGRQLTDGEFTFQLVNEATGEVVSTATNDAAGMVDFDKAANVAPDGMEASCLKFDAEGTYTYVVKEVSAEKDATVSYSDEVVKFVVVVSRGSDGKLTSDGGHYYYYADAASTQGTEFAADQHPTITNKVKGIVLGLTKVNGAGEGLAGAEYGLYTKDADGNDLLIATATSNGSGKMTFGAVDGSLLGEGMEYWYREISAPAGYKVSYTETKHFTVDHDKSGYFLKDLSGNRLTASAEPGVALELGENVVDEEISVVLNKVDSARNGISGAKLSVLVAATSEVVDSWTSNGAGHAISGLAANTTYVLREDAAPDGFKKAADVEFTVNASGIVTLVSGASTTVNGKSVVNAYAGTDSVSLIDYRATETVKEKKVSRSIPKTGDTATSPMVFVVGALVVIALAAMVWVRSRK